MLLFTSDIRYSRHRIAQRHLFCTFEKPLPSTTTITYYISHYRILHFREPFIITTHDDFIFARLLEAPLF